MGRQLHHHRNRIATSLFSRAFHFIIRKQPGRYDVQQLQYHTFKYFNAGVRPSTQIFSAGPRLMRAWWVLGGESVNSKNYE
jgi:hypothetical protein